MRRNLRKSAVLFLLLALCVSGLSACSGGDAPSSGNDLAERVKGRGLKTDRSWAVVEEVFDRFLLGGEDYMDLFATHIEKDAVDEMLIQAGVCTVGVEGAPAALDVYKHFHDKEPALNEDESLIGFYGSNMTFQRSAGAGYAIVKKTGDLYCIIEIAWDLTLSI